MLLDEWQLTGRRDDHLVPVAEGHSLQAEAALAFGRLQADAAAAGFQLAIASSFRSFERQLAIWNGKAAGERAVHDDDGADIPLLQLEPAQRVAAILRFSALPGTSRHHWGTDLDVFDAAALPAGYRVQLSPAEVAAGGLFDPLHRWLDERMASGQSHGFYRPYGEDRGGVAPERWHLSYAPLAQPCEGRLDGALLQRCWKECGSQGLLLEDVVLAELDSILARYVAVAEEWCPP